MDALHAVPPSAMQVKRWDRRPMLLNVHGTLAVIFYQRSGKHNQTARGQVWWRSSIPGSQPKRCDFIDGTAVCGDVILKLGKVDDQHYNISISVE
jgi:hypothetical protein